MCTHGVCVSLHAPSRTRVKLNFIFCIEKIDKLVSIYSNERIAKRVMALDYSEDKLELTLETRAIKAREAAAKEGGDGATGDIALHMPPTAA